ncbi:MAG: hypothetical protein AAB880_01545 [Patescibacteria group bacterium]
MLKKPRVPLLKFDNGVVIGANDSVYLTYMGQDRRPYRLRTFIMADKMRLCLEVDALSEVPLPEKDTPIRVTWPITESHDGYTFPTRLIGIIQPSEEGAMISLVVETPNPKDVRKMDNRRDEIRISARWPATIAWKNEREDFSITGVIHNISFTGCSVHISTKHIEEIGEAEAVLSFFLSDRFEISMQPTRHLIGATDADSASAIFKPYANIEALIRGRTKTRHDGEDVEVISFQLVYERRQLNQLITTMQLPRKATAGS